MIPSGKGIVPSAIRSLGSWIVLNPLLAGFIVLLLIGALAGWGRAIERGRAADGYLKKAQEETEKLGRIKIEAESAQRKVEELKGKIIESDRKLSESRKKLEEARKIARVEFKAPATDGEVVARYRVLGYRGRVRQ